MLQIFEVDMILAYGGASFHGTFAKYSLNHQISRNLELVLPEIAHTELLIVCPNFDSPAGPS